MTSFILKPRPPFRLDLTAWTLRRRPENAIDQWDGSIYRRVLSVGKKPRLLEVEQLSGSGPPRLSVRILGCRGASDSRAVATAALERLLGIRLDLASFYDFAANKPKLGPLARRFRGMKPPRFLTGFECLVNAIANQQVSLASGIQLLNRFAEAFGQPFKNNGNCQFAFPRPDDLVQINQEDLRSLGFSRNKATAVLNLAGLARRGEFDLDELQALTDEDVARELCGLHGVGRWTAEYAMLRGMGRLNVFPGDDVGARNNLWKWLDLSVDFSYENVASVLNRWKGFGGLIYFHLLLDKLAAGGHVIANE